MTNLHFDCFSCVCSYEFNLMIILYLYLQSDDDFDVLYAVQRGIVKVFNSAVPNNWAQP